MQDFPPVAGDQPPLMLYSLAEFASILRPLFEDDTTRSVCEIGAETGSFTSLLADHLKRGTLDRVTIVDPILSAGVRDLAATKGLFLLEMTSLMALQSLEPHDIYALDGDHNYYTVSNELLQIYRQSRNAIVLLHDVGWPCGRRDQYYDPSSLPSEAVHPHSFTAALVPGNFGVVDSGMSSNGAYAVALVEGGLGNGVYSAVEDFLSMNPQLDYTSLPIMHGLGIIFPQDHKLREVILKVVHPSEDWLRLAHRIDASRMRNWIALIHAQDELNKIKSLNIAGRQS